MTEKSGKNPTHPRLPTASLDRPSLRCLWSDRYGSKIFSFFHVVAVAKTSHF
jgi:hypothetical protein